MPGRSGAASLHPSAVVGSGVELGEGVVVGPFVSLLGPMVVGDGVVISAGAALGGPAEVAGVGQDPDTAQAGCGVVLEPDVVIREGVVIHQGTRRPTTVGRGSWVLNRSYLAHDVVLGRDCVISAGVSVGGHCTLADLVTVGMNAVVHQGRHIGRGAMVGMGAVVSHDVPPWAKAYGVPVRLHGVNFRALQRAGVNPEIVAALSVAYAEGSTDVVLPPDLREDFAWWAAIENRDPIPVSRRPR